LQLISRKYYTLIEVQLKRGYILIHSDAQLSGLLAAATAAAHWEWLYSLTARVLAAAFDPIRRDIGIARSTD
jgi:hypothetical protein